MHPFHAAMNKHRILLTGSIAALLLLTHGEAVSQAILSIRDARISAKVEHDKTTGIFTYSYLIENPSTNSGDISGFSLDIIQPPGTLSLVSENLPNESDPMEPVNTLNRSDLSAKGIQLIPVRTTAPSNWISAITYLGEARWGGSRIHPTELVRGFEQSTRGMPTLRNARITPIIPEELLANEDTMTEEEIAQVEERNRNLSVRTKTVGPTAPPKMFDPLKFTEYILDLKNQSVDLGWIKTTDAATSLDQKLQSIRAIASEVSGNQIPRARGQDILSLGAQFLQFVESNSCKEFDCPLTPDPKPLTSESYALLFYNMDYFLSQVRTACGIPNDPAPAPKRSAPSPLPSPKRKR